MNEPAERRSRKSKPYGISLVNCLHCGAENPEYATKCWICQGPLRSEGACKKSPDFARPSAKWPTSLPLFLLTPALVIMGFGVERINSDFLLPYLVFVSLPMLVIAIAIRDKWTRSARETHVGGSIMASLGLVLMAIVATLVLIVVCGLIFLFTVCTSFEMHPTHA